VSDPDCSLVLGIYQVKESKLSLTQLVVIFVVKYLSVYFICFKFTWFTLECDTCGVFGGY